LAALFGVNGLKGHFNIAKGKAKRRPWLTDRKVKALTGRLKQCNPNAT
jgi:hypothetical protein